MRTLFSICLCCLSWFVWSQSAAPKYSNEFLYLGAGARSFGLASSGVAFSDDVTSGYWNPAGLLQIESDHQAILMHSAYFGGIANYDFGAFATRIRDSSRIAFSVVRFAIDDIPDTRFLVDANGAIDYSKIQYFSAADYAFLASYADRLSWIGGLDIGGSVKIIHRIVGNFSTAWGFGLDAGAMKRYRNWIFGVSVRDVFGTFNTWQHNADELREVYQQTGNDIPVNSTEVTLPRMIIGVSRMFTLPARFSVLVNAELQNTFDGKRNTVVKSDFASIDPIGSIEVGFRDLVFLRFGAGQFQRITNLNYSRVWRYQPTGGIGFKIRELSIDYAMTDFADQAEGLYSHVFSIKVDFNAE